MRNKPSLRVLFAFLAIIGFVLGFHSIDIAWNMNNLDRDLTFGGVLMDKTEIYRQGLNEIFFSFYLLLFLFWVSLKE